MNIDITGYATMRDFPKILISSFEIAMPPVLSQNYGNYFDNSEKILKEENVGTILNVANDVKKHNLHDEMYERLGIKYIFLGINDTLLDPPPKSFLPKVLEIYQDHIKEHGQEKAFLVNCMSGINRSALAVAVILWKTTIPRKWSTIDDMIEEMRYIQIRDRSIAWILNNDNFVSYLKEWCENNYYSNNY